MTLPRTPHPARIRVRATLSAGLLACTLLASPIAQADPAAAPSAPDLLRLYLEKETAGVSGRVEVSIGTLDSRMHLAPCASMQPFVPPGARLWGRTTLGVRCTEGATWQVYLPVQVRVFGLAPVAVRPMNAGDSIAEGDLRMEEVELTRYPLGALADPAQLADKQLSRPVAPGQPLMRDQFRARQIVATGDMVKLVYAGHGFSVSTQGRALSAASEGQSVRVVTDSGRTVSGTARQDRVVELRF